MSVLIDFACLVRDEPRGLLVPGCTGFVFSNQCFGVACAHPKLEGVYIPLSFDDELLSTALQDAGCWQSITKDPVFNLDTVDVLLGELGLPLVTDRLVPEDNSDDVRSGEAWLRVIVSNPPENSVLAPLAGRKCVLIWCNGD